MDSLGDIYSNFKKELEDNQNILSQSIELFDARNFGYPQELHYKIVETCFVEMFNSFENFIEKAFISYLTRKPDLKGNKYKCYVSPKDEKHAYNILKGKNNYPKWTDIKEICLIVDLYFEDCGPFKQLCTNPSELQEIKNIRHYIVHKSENALENYKKVLYKHVSIYNMKPAEFLLTFDKSIKVPYFTLYKDFLVTIVDSICNAN